MGTDSISSEIKDCAELLYQNKEIEAYKQLEILVPKINVALQILTNFFEQNQTQEAAEMKKEVLYSVETFMEAYQKQDILALADILYYQLSEEVKIAEKI